MNGADRVAPCTARAGGAFLRLMRAAVLAVPLVLPAFLPASAQVTINLRALDAVPKAPPAHRSAPHAKRGAASAAKPRVAALPSPGPPPAIEAAPPPAPAPMQPIASAASAGPKAPAAPSPPSGPAAATPAAVPQHTPSAPATAAALSGPAAPSAPALSTAPPPPRRLSVAFAPGDAALSAEARSALTALVKAAHPTPDTTFEVAARAPGTGDDASAARRLSLARALAIRSALVADGVPAANVYMRALGAPPPAAAADADRASITVMGEAAPAPAATAAQSAPQQASKPK